MKPIPVVFHIGALQIHTYGIGLALTFWFAYRYFERRLKKAGFPTAWLSVTFIEVVVAAIVGARAVHVIANFGYYGRNPIEIFAIWHGGLSSFGGLALAIPVGFFSARSRCPELKSSVAADLVAPVLVLAWALGRLLGPQLMVAGGGKPTSSWIGMYYAGEIGKRLPVPLFQAAECLVVFAVTMLVERAVKRRGGTPVGLVTVVAAGLWDLSRFFDEYFYLTHDNGTVAIEIGSLVITGLCIGIGIYLVAQQRQRRSERSSEGPAIDSPLSSLT